jgi:hypothetical protein
MVAGVVIIIGAMLSAILGVAVIGARLGPGGDITGGALAAVAIAYAVFGTLHIVVGMRLLAGAGWSWISGLALAGLGIASASMSFGQEPFLGVIGVLLNSFLMFALVAQRRWFRPIRA